MLVGSKQCVAYCHTQTTLRIYCSELRGLSGRRRCQMAEAMLGSWPRHLMSSEYLGIRDSTAFALEGPANIRREQSQEAAEFHIKNLYFTQQARGLETGGQATSLWTVARAPLSELLSLGG